MEVFRTLMAWRRTPLSPDRVKALNMVEIEFHGVKSVETAYGELFRHFQTQITEENSVVWHEANAISCACVPAMSAKPLPRSSETVG
jgi:hypothetical protein